MGVIGKGLFGQFTGFDFLFTLVALGFWVSYLVKGESIIVFVLGNAWKESFLRKYLANVMFKGWAFFGGLVLGFVPDGIWLGSWKTALLLGALLIVFTRGEKKAKKGQAEEQKAKADSATS